MTRQFGLPEWSEAAPGQRASLKEAGRWGRLPPGLAISKGKSLFPRIDKKNEKEPPPASPSGAPPIASRSVSTTPLPFKPPIAIDDFSKLDLRVGQVLAAEKVAGSKKLLKLQVDIGSERRQVVAGIGTRYPPEDLIGKRIVLITNLQPAKIMGVESQGMLLAAGEEALLGLATFLEEIPPGTRIK
jgi:methionyl-tRNA synthetase